MTTSFDTATAIVNRAAGRAPLLASTAALAWASSLAVATPAAAQTAPPTRQPDPESELTDIVVTANRAGAQSLQDMPIAFAVVNVD